MKKALLCAGLLLAFSVLDRPRATVEARSQNDFKRSVGYSRYEADASTKARILQDYPQLQVGMRKKQVEGLIGPPDYGELGTKDLLGASGSYWCYYLSFSRMDIESDANLVLLFFDRQGHLRRAVPVNVEGLKPLGITEEELRELR